MSVNAARLWLGLFAVLLAMPALGQRSRLERGFNIFTVAQDVELGRQVSKEMESRVEILRNSSVSRYLDALCRRLASKAPDGAQFSFQCRIANEKSINAVGLPGGFLYIHRGTIEAAASEAQFASVIAHEIAHVVLRHGTHQLSKAYALQVPASALSAVGRTPIMAVLLKIEGGFTANSLLIKNTLEAETQADLMGVHIVHDAGYDPMAAAQFLDRLLVETNPKLPAGTGHPDPANRRDAVIKEIERLGGAPTNAIFDSEDYRDMRSLIFQIP